MSSHSSSSSSQARSRSSSRGGSRRRDGGQNRGAGQRRSLNSQSGGSARSGAERNRSGAAKRPAAKPNIFQRLLAAIGLGKKAAEKKPQPRKTAPRSSPAASASRSREETSKPSSRPPEIVEVTSPRLYVGNLSYDATESDLFDLFGGVGKVGSAEIVTHRRTQRSKGYAFVEMLHMDDAKRAVEILHDKDFMGRKLVVSGAKSDGAKD